jgi:thiol-disulfide isomerase/thioredoxin
MRRACLALSILGFLLMPLSGAGQQQAEEVKLEVIKGEELPKRLEKMRGKVVVLDVWAEFCHPCKKEFPHLVELHEKYASKGVACVSVSVDPAEDKEKTLEFLKKHKATFTNFLFDERQKVWQEHFHILGPPSVFVYAPDGKLAKQFDPDVSFSYADVEKLVQQLLAK